jgi:UDP-N-acetylmuramoyl-tripeptide--D-alanyl-D-alanine ligase
MQKNKAEFNGIELNTVFRENKLVNIGEDFRSKGVVADSREIEPGNIFIAIKGENIDAHNFIAQAFDSGAAACVVDKEWYEKNYAEFPGKSFIVDESSVNAFGRLGAFHRSRFDFPVLAIGGSNGKTTTKEMTASVLSEKFNVLKTYGNFNNQIGLPIMLLQFDESYDMAVLELGTNMPGEMSILAEWAKPTHALITNIGKEHLEQLIDIDGVELEETFLFGAVRSDGFAFINYDDERLVRYHQLMEKYLVYGTSDNAQVKCKIEMNDRLNPKLEIRYVEVEEEIKINIGMNTIGYASGLNALAAAAAGLHFEVKPGKIKEALENFFPDVSKSYGRMALLKHKDITIINDTYNANPASMKIALDTLAAYKTGGRKIAVLGDMREMGESMIAEHHELFKLAVEKSDFAYFTGCDTGISLEKFDNKADINYFADKIKLAEFITGELKPGDVILLKASRGVALEEVVDFIRKNY